MAVLWGGERPDCLNPGPGDLPGLRPVFVPFEIFLPGSDRDARSVRPCRAPSGASPTAACATRPGTQRADGTRAATCCDQWDGPGSSPVTKRESRRSSRRRSVAAARTGTGPGTAGTADRRWTGTGPGRSATRRPGSGLEVGGQAVGALGPLDDVGSRPHAPDREARDGGGEPGLARELIDSLPAQADERGDLDGADEFHCAESVGPCAHESGYVLCCAQALLASKALPRSGPGSADTPRGPATTEVPVMTVVDSTFPRRAGVR